jgi:stage II sporulation protein D
MEIEMRRSICRVAVALVALACLDCIPYVAKEGRERAVKVALLSGVDQVDVCGVNNNKYLSNYRITSNENFPLLIEPRDGKVAVNGKEYRGGLEVRKIDGNLWVINNVDIESYLKGVVPCEIGGVSENQIEAAKAQAVAARTYAAAHMGQYAQLGFDLYATVQDQVYNGIASERAITSRAVESTSGEVLFYNNKPIEAKYHSTCGGRTADYGDAWAGSAPPYLRSVSCRYCAESPYYEWNRNMKKEDFFAHLRSRLAKMNIYINRDELIQSFRIARNKTSKRVNEITLVTDKNEYKIPNYRIRTLLGGSNDTGGVLKSNYFYIKTKRDSVVIEGKGFGHGVGMCQFGALEMANEGKNYRQILYHYYRGTRIKKMR